MEMTAKKKNRLLSNAVPLSPHTESQHNSRYAKYVLCVLVIVNILNFLDRSIVGILIEDIKRDLNLTDANAGFLGGAAFSIFYATFGIALGRLADTWSRKKLISIGLSAWSCMTALCAAARSFLPLALCRFGVGVGESSASPAAYSMLYDYFPKHLRTTVLGIYYGGAALGGGLGVFIGGQVLDLWATSYPDTAMAPLGLKGWQAAFLIVGLPGLLVALWVMTLKEPERGQGDGIKSQDHTHPFRESVSILLSMLPILNLLVFASEGRGRACILINVGFAFAVAGVAAGLSWATGDVMQWCVLGAGAFASLSWVQTLAVKDTVIFKMIFRCKTLAYLIAGISFTMFKSAAVSFWLIPYFHRYYDVTIADLGNIIGSAHVVLGLTGVITGGIVADMLRRYTSRGKLYVIFGASVGTMLFNLIMLLTDSLWVGYGAAFASTLVGAMVVGPAVSTITDMILPRGRATLAAFYTMVTMLSGITLGPYVIGYLSDAFMASGASGGEALRLGMLWTMPVALLGLFFIFKASRNIEADEASLLDRARSYGEDV